MQHLFGARGQSAGKVRGGLTTSNNKRDFRPSADSVQRASGTFLSHSLRRTNPFFGIRERSGRPHVEDRREASERYRAKR